MTNTQLAERFANTEKEGKANSMFIDGDTIFSYGYHFPIARKTDKTDENGRKIVLFTDRGYSMTTAKHKNQVWGALAQAGHRIITCDVSMSRASNAIESLNKEIDELHGKEKRARKEYTRESYYNQAEKLTEDVATLRQAFSL
jgi:hypothetical protein